jgi:hypothetical protein
MNHKSVYNLTVRGESVTLTFSKINDSRRLPSYYDNKKPNLFRVNGAVRCEVEMAVALSPEWWKGKHLVSTFNDVGFSFCYFHDNWSSQRGRHAALKDALAYHGHDDTLNEEIVAAFTDLEKRRIKVKGPERQPKTAKPKVRKPSLRSVLMRMNAILEQMAPPTAFYSLQGYSGPAAPNYVATYEFDSTSYKEKA